MNEYGKIQRLNAENYIGKGHIIAEYHSGEENFPLHWHNYFELEVVLSGRGKHYLNGEEYDISAGSAYLLTPIDYHKIDCISPMEILNISFDDVFLAEEKKEFFSLSGDGKRAELDEEALKRFVSAAKLLMFEISSDGPSKIQLLHYLLAFFKLSPASASESLGGLGRAISYMEIHFREKISLSMLSEISGYNPTYFSELFKKVTGESYIERLKNMRLNYARHLLLDSFSVSDSCFTSGFGSLSNFLSSFKEKYGVSPSEYKLMHKKSASE